MALIKLKRGWCSGIFQTWQRQTGLQISVSVESIHLYLLIFRAAAAAAAPADARAASTYVVLQFCLCSFW